MTSAVAVDEDKGIKGAVILTLVRVIWAIAAFIEVVRFGDFEGAGFIIELVLSLPLIVAAIYCCLWIGGMENQGRKKKLPCT